MGKTETETIVRRIVKLPFRLQVAFAAGATEHLLRRAGREFKMRGFRKITDPALDEMWQVALGGTADPKALRRHERECTKWAPDSEDEPDAGDITYGLLAVAAACALARGKDVERELDSLIENARFAVAHRDQDESPASEDDLEGWRRRPRVVEEAAYHARLAAALQRLGENGVSRKKLAMV